MSDDLLREASDPTTPPKRLAQMYAESEERSRTGPTSEGARFDVHEALAGNPSLPLELLEPELQGQTHTPYSLSAWYNLSTPRLVTPETRGAFRKAAMVRLFVLTAQTDTGLADGLDLDLDILVMAWAKASPTVMATTTGSESPVVCRAFARHLASLFGLPWPEG